MSNIFFKKVSLLSLSTLIKFFVQFIIIIIASKRLSLADYGLYQSVWMYLNFFAVLGLFGFNNLLLSHTIADVVSWVLGAGLKFYLFVCFIYSAIIFFLFFVVHDFSVTQKWLLLFLLLSQNISFVQDALLIKKENFKTILVNVIIYLSFYITVHFYALFFNYSLTTIMVGVILATFIKIISQLYIFKTLRFLVVQSNIGIQWLYVWLNELLSNVVKWLDKWVVIFLLSKSDFAIYFNGTFEIPLFLLFLGVVNNITMVELSKKNVINSKLIKVIFHKGTLLLSIFILPSFCFLFFYSTNIFHFIFNDKYLASVPIFKITLLLLPVRIVCSTAALQVYNKSNIIFIGSILDFCISATLMFLLYPIINMAGLVIAFVVATYFQVAFYLWHTYKTVNIPLTQLFPLYKICFIFISSLIMMLLLKYGLPVSSENVSMFFSFFITMMMILYFLYRFKIIKNFNK